MLQQVERFDGTNPRQPRDRRKRAIWSREESMLAMPISILELRLRSLAAVA